MRKQRKKRLEEVLKEVPTTPSLVLHFDDASSAQGYRDGLILTSLDVIVMKCILRFSFCITNNKVEYEALIVGLNIAKMFTIYQVKVLSDS